MWEAPQIQQLHEKYRDDHGVVFPTINAFDPDLDKDRAWMADNDYDFPVLVDDNFVTRYGVGSYPTTWFADRDGRIVFEYGGASGVVYEEFLWRVEMLQAEAGAEVAGESGGYFVRRTTAADLLEAVRGLHLDSSTLDAVEEIIRERGEAPTRAANL